MKESDSDHKATEVKITYIKEGVDKLCAAQERVEDKLNELEVKVARVDTLMNGGPGHWQICIAHAADLVRIRRDLDKTRFKFAKFTGCATLSSGLTLLIEHFVFK